MKKYKYYGVAILTIIVSYFFVFDNDTHAITFCAYNTTFVEFSEGFHRWGTILLDQDGRPVPCEESIIDHTASTRTSI